MELESSIEEQNESNEMERFRGKKRKIEETKEKNCAKETRIAEKKSWREKIEQKREEKYTRIEQFARNLISTFIIIDK